MRILNPEDNNGNDLPWINEYLQNDGETGDVSLVSEIKLSTKGYIVICKSFKGFLFKDSKLYTYVKEAMEYWKQFPNPGYSIYGVANSNGKIGLAIEDDEEGIFTVDKKAGAIQKVKSQSVLDALPEQNMFIRTQNPSSTRGRKRKDTPEDTVSDQTSV